MLPDGGAGAFVVTTNFCSFCTVLVMIKFTAILFDIFRSLVVFSFLVVRSSDYVYARKFALTFEVCVRLGLPDQNTCKQIPIFMLQVRVRTSVPEKVSK